MSGAEGRVSIPGDCIDGVSIHGCCPPFAIAVHLNVRHSCNVTHSQSGVPMLISEFARVTDLPAIRCVSMRGLGLLQPQDETARVAAKRQCFHRQGYSRGRGHPERAILGMSLKEMRPSMRQRRRATYMRRRVEIMPRNLLA